MTQAAHAASVTKSPLDAAQKIVAELHGMTTEHQALALKFAMETLGLQLPAGHAQASQVPSHASQAQIHAPQPPPHAQAGGAGHAGDIKSFTAAKAPKSDQQFAAVVAYFYQFEAKPNDRKEVIDPELMKEAARLAGRPQVARWAMTLNNAKNAGYLNAAGTGKFKLSPVGENLVAITLPGNAANSQGDGGTSNKGRGRKKKLTGKKR
jgi:hypothetical protein